MIIKAPDGSFCIMDPGSLDVVFRALGNEDGTMQFVAQYDVQLPPEAVQEILEGIAHFNDVVLNQGQFEI